jgi:hypothetical protein
VVARFAAIAGGGSHGDDGVGVEVNQLCRQFIKGRGTAISVLDLDVLPFDIAEFTKPRTQCIDQMRDASRREIAEPIDFHRLLSPRLQRPCRRAAERRNELSSSHEAPKPWDWENWGLTIPYPIGPYAVSERCQVTKNDAPYSQWRGPLWVDAVEKVGGKSRMRNNRIEEACRSTQRCANYWLLESKIASRHPQNPFSTVSVKSGKARNEHNMSGLPRKADLLCAFLSTRPSRRGSAACGP